MCSEKEQTRGAPRPMHAFNAVPTFERDILNSTFPATNHPFVTKGRICVRPGGTLTLTCVKTRARVIKWRSSGPAEEGEDKSGEATVVARAPMRSRFCLCSCNKSHAVNIVLN